MKKYVYEIHNQILPGNGFRMSVANISNIKSCHKITILDENTIIFNDSCVALIDYTDDHVDKIIDVRTCKFINAIRFKGLVDVYTIRKFSEVLILRNFLKSLNSKRYRKVVIKENNYAPITKYGEVIIHTYANLFVVMKRRDFKKLNHQIKKEAKAKKA